MKQKYFLLLHFINLSMINFTHLKNSYNDKNRNICYFKLFSYLKKYLNLEKSVFLECFIKRDVFAQSIISKCNISVLHTVFYEAIINI